MLRSPLREVAGNVRELAFSQVKTHLVVRFPRLVYLFLQVVTIRHGLLRLLLREYAYDIGGYFKPEAFAREKQDGVVREIDVSQLLLGLFDQLIQPFFQFIHILIFQIIIGDVSGPLERKALGPLGRLGEEALDGLWTTGLKYYPVFIGWMNGQEDLSSSGRATTRNFWTNKTYDPVTDLVRVIRKYRPDVVVTHDFSGEYRNIQHQLTARLIAEAAVLAGDPGYDKDAGIPAWEVRKVYIHLYEENRIYMDWNKPLNDEQAITPLFLATEAFDKHHSQHIYNSMEVHGVRYDNQCFGLYYSSVGEDKKKDDLFENIE